jgi:ElaB/YqjD/DUF883 family membrane-anchored ribosome-binding protein
MTSLEHACEAIITSDKASLPASGVATGDETKALRNAARALLQHNRDLEERMTKLAWRVGELEQALGRVDEWMKDRP